MPAVLKEGLIPPVEAFSDKPAGVEVNVPPAGEIKAGVTVPVLDLQKLVLLIKMQLIIR